MKKSLIFCSLILCIIQANAQQLSISTIASGGNTHNASFGTIDETIGEMSAVTTFNSANSILTQGFQQGWLMFVGIDNSEDDLTDIQLFPNPVTDQLFIKFDKPLGEVVIRITDMLGKSIVENSEKLTGSGEIRMDIKNFSKGIYSIQIHPKNTAVADILYSRTFMIQ